MSIETIGLMASIFAVVMFVSPIAQIQSIRKIGKSDEVSPVMYMAMVVNCSLWTIYGAGIVTGTSSPPMQLELYWEY